MLASEKGHRWIGKCLDHYRNKTFQMEGGRIVDVDIIVDVLAHFAHVYYGFRYYDFSRTPQCLSEGITIYLSFVFAGMWGEVNKNTYTLHLREQAWIENVQEERRQENLIRRVYRYLCSHYRFWGGCIILGNNY